MFYLLLVLIVVAVAVVVVLVVVVGVLLLIIVARCVFVLSCLHSVVWCFVLVLLAFCYTRCCC